MLSDRSSGLLLHVTSLPSPFGIGDLGPHAYRFVDFLRRAGQQVWQVLPVVPIGLGHSPYSSPSTFAGNPLLISPKRLHGDGLLTDEDLADRPAFPDDRVVFERVIPYKLGLLERAFERFDAYADDEARTDFARFRAEHAAWLDDYALFEALRDAHDSASWTAWPAALAHRDPDALARTAAEHARTTRRHAFWQYLFHRQWRSLCAYSHAHGVRILGDLPIYVAHNSADVWAHPHLFFLDDAGQPTVVAGVPPDYFSATGQRWGNPLYRWDVMQRNDFAWWTRRLARALTLFDVVRLDHFRGFAAYWEIPADAETAVHGRWVDGPGTALFDAVTRHLGDLPILAENLGIITDDVTALMQQLGLPGMAVLSFGLGGDTGAEHLPHNYTPDLVAYTGTHDNDTLVGWWTGNDLTDAERAHARQYLNLAPEDDDTIHWRCIRLLAGSAARLIITPVQDVLGLGSAARMNTPGQKDGNWTWRLAPDTLTDEHARHLHTLARLYGRIDE